MLVRNNCWRRARQIVGRRLRRRRRRRRRVPDGVENGAGAGRSLV